MSPSSSKSTLKEEEEDEEACWFAKVNDSAWNLRDAPEIIRGNKKIVMAAVKHLSDALGWASADLRNDKDVILAAISHNGRMLAEASPRLRNDKDVVLAAIQKPEAALALKVASPELQRDKEFVIRALKISPDSIRFVHPDIQHDPEVLIAAGLFDKDHEADNKQQKSNHPNEAKRKIALSTRFSFDPHTRSDVNNFTKLFKAEDYVRDNFKVYAPNAFDKKSCDPNWTDFNHPCRGTSDTCLFDDDSLKTGHPTDDWCWRCSYRYQLQQAKDSGGFLLQIVENPDESILDSRPTLGKGQEIERDMANSLNLKIFHVYRPIGKHNFQDSFHKWSIHCVVAKVKEWYDEGCQDMSECVAFEDVAVHY